MKQSEKFTNAALFDSITELLKEQRLFPDILDYSLSGGSVTEIFNYQWDTIGRLYFGSNEGIYLDVYAEGFVTTSGRYEQIRLGTFKTLHENLDALYKMAKLQADFMWKTRKFVNDHLDDFTWIGYNVTFYKDDNRKATYTCCTEGAKNRLLEDQLPRYSYAAVRDNTDRKEWIVYPGKAV